MALTVYNIKKWYRMLTGTSFEHVHQGVGRCFSTDHISGYYNDMTEKITMTKDFGEDGLPVLKVDDGSIIYFPIAIFQYGLGAYDTFLLQKDSDMRQLMLKCADWAVTNQQKDGGWSNFFYENPENPYSSMAQGEGVSLVLRAYQETSEEKYAEAAHRAINFMLHPIENGGATEYRGNEVFLHEFTDKPVVLNGWIFSVFGLFDYCLTFAQPEVNKILERTIQTMANHLGDYDNGYWSMYNCEKMITSPFYHSLHIAQMDAMYQISGMEVFRETKERWEKYQKSRLNRTRSFVKKAMQKIMER